MSVNNLPGIQVTGDEAADQSSIIRQALAEEQNRLANPNGQAAGSPPPIKVNLFGQSYEFTDTNALNAAMEKTFTDYAAMMKEQQGAAAAAPRVDPNVRQTPLNSFDKERFGKLLEEDTLTGLNYAIGHLVFGQDVPDAAGIIRENLGKTVETRQQIAATQFRAAHAHDFVPTQQSVQMLENIRMKHGLSADSADSWEMALAYGRQQGLIEQPRQQQQTQEYAPAQYDNNTGRRVSAPPNMGRGNNGGAGAGGELEALLASAENMPLDKLEELTYRLAGVGRQ